MRLVRSYEPSVFHELLPFAASLSHSHTNTVKINCSPPRSRGLQVCLAPQTPHKALSWFTVNEMFHQGCSILPSCVPCNSIPAAARDARNLGFLHVGATPFIRISTHARTKYITTGHNLTGQSRIGDGIKTASLTLTLTLGQFRPKPGLIPADTGLLFQIGKVPIRYARFPAGGLGLSGPTPTSRRH